MNSKDRVLLVSGGDVSN